MIHFKITPNNRLKNEHVEQLAQSLHLYKTPLERLTKKGLNKQNFFSFETVIEKENTSFYLTVPHEIETIAKKSLETTWGKAAIEIVSEPLIENPLSSSLLTYKNHYMFSLKVDKRTLGILPSVLETLNMMLDNEKIYLQYLFTPAEKDWFVSAAEAYENFKKGNMPQKLHFNKKAVVQTGVKMLAYTALEIADLTSELITGEGIEKINLNSTENAMILRDGRLRNETINKTKGDAFETEIRIGIFASNKDRSKSLMRMVTTTFRELDGDNSLVDSGKNTNKIQVKMKERKQMNMINKDYMSIKEVGRLLLLPTSELQDQYKIPCINTLQLEVDRLFTEKGLYLGDVEVKNKTEKVYQNIDNHDILCLPRVIIGGMGQGKTKGYAANFIVESVLNGFGCLAIDPAKGELGDEAEAFLPSDKVIRIKLGETPISLDWCESESSIKSKNRMANTILGFFSANGEDAGMQTSRYLRAAVMSMKTGKLSEIIRIFEDDVYRNERVSELSENSIHKMTLMSFGDESESRQRQILNPIYNRLDTILGDEYLMECMESDNKINLVELMEQKKAIIIDVPKAELGTEAVDLIVNLLSSKLDLSMTLRKSNHPFFAIFDEPHQFLKSARIWKSAAVESRKWRLGYVWLFHSWEQIPSSLSEIIKAAGCHYTLYNSSKKTFKDLSEEIQPYTFEDGIKLKQYHTINVLRAGDGVQKPFICKIAAPPSMRNK